MLQICKLMNIDAKLRELYWSYTTANKVDILNWCFFGTLELHIFTTLATYKNLTLKKSFGQHYLHDEMYCARIADAILEFPDLKIVEVGPGAGAITKLFPA